jgi:glycosyltransferase involved in cell wall biosynthesis
MPGPLVSIIIPVYNSKMYLQQAIESAVGQTWPDTEIIIVDDGSTDGSLAIAQTYQNDNIKVFTQPNRGASAARNKGIKEAKGQYIQFLDADDGLSANKIEAQVNVLRGKPDHLALCASVPFFDDNKPDNSDITHEWFAQGSEDMVDFLIKLYGGGYIGPGYGGMIQPNAFLTPKTLINKAGFWNEHLTLDDDGEYFCRVMLAAKGIRYADSCINYYRKHQNAANLSAKNDHKSLNSALQSAILKTRHLLSKTNDPSATFAMGRNFWELCFNIYPKYQDLYAIAYQHAMELSPGFKFIPYQTGIKRMLSNVFGWKSIRYLQYLKHK